MDWAWSHCACLVRTHRLKCNTAYLSHHVTSRNLELRSNIDLTVQGHHVNASARLDKRNMMLSQLSVYVAFLVQRLFAKMYKMDILAFFYPLRLKHCCQLKSDDILAKEQLNSYQVLISPVSYLK